MAKHIGTIENYAELNEGMTVEFQGDNYLVIDSHCGDNPIEDGDLIVMVESETHLMPNGEVYVFNEDEDVDDAVGDYYFAVDGDEPWVCDYEYRILRKVS